MLKAQQKIALAIQSFLALMLAYTVFYFFQWAIVEIGAYLSGFNGTIVWNMCSFSARAGKWSRLQVMALYLSPVMVFFLIFLVFSFKPKFPVKWSKLVLFFYGWFYVLLLVRIFFVPLWEIVGKEGVYYALEWLRFYRPEQLFLAVILAILFIISLFNVSSLFSAGFIVSTGKFLKPKDIFPQLPYVWYIPLSILTIIIFVFSDLHFLPSCITLLMGILFLMAVNTPVVVRYQVLVK